MPGPARRSIAVVLGTRPEIIKLAPVLRGLGSAAFVVHTGQHYDATLSEVFFDQLGLATPGTRLDIGGETRGRQLGSATSALSDLFAEQRPSAVVTQGDTNTTAAAALAANATGVPMVHVEAGLRSFDRAMPEEHNRVVADHLSDLLLAPTETSRRNLHDEAIEPDRVRVTGNTIVEMVREMMPPDSKRRELLDRFGVDPNRFVLSTLHRPENVDDPDTLAAILRALGEVPAPVVLPLHPRTVARIDRFGLDELLRDLVVVEPIGYREFLGLGAESALLISDSGGVQEEVSVYKRPVIVVRRSTERPEVLGTFAERIVPGPEIAELAKEWVDDLEAVHDRLKRLPSPYGDGTAGAQCVAAIKTLVADA